MTKNQIIEYFKNNRLDIQKARANFFAPHSCFSAYARCRIFKNDGLSPVFTYLGTFNNFNYFFQMMNEEVIFRLARRVYADYQKDPKSLTDKAKTRKALMKETDKIWENYCQAKKNGMSRQMLLGFFRKLNNNLSDWWDYSAVVGEDKGIIIDLDIIPAFARRHKISAGAARDIINVLAHPTELSILNRERADFFRICLAVLKKEKKRKLLKMADYYIKNYFWAKTDFYYAKKITPELLFKEINLEIKGKNARQIEADLKVIKSNFIKIERKKKKLLAKIKLSAQDEKDIKYSKSVISWQDERKEEMMKNFFYVFSLIEEIAEYMKTKYENMVACTPKEIEKILISGKSILKKKEELFIAFEKDKKPVYFKGQEAKELLEAALETQTGNEIKGVVASKGNKNKYTGIVRIIFNPDKQQFNEGEILVTSMTRIEFVSLMRKAKAIITDEGGIACHAAIVSRELGLPCIIGTKIATKVLKDGDQIEMNMEKGIVKIVR